MDLPEYLSELIRNVKLYKNPKPVISIPNLKNIDSGL